MTADWVAIEGAFRAGIEPLRTIATNYGSSESNIRKRAKKNGWTRDPTATVRERVKAHFAGSGTQNGAQSAALRTIADAVESSVIYLELGEANAVRVLGRVAEFLEAVKEPRDLKTLNDANAGAIDTIRRIRQLDDPAQKTIELTGFRMVGE